MAHWLHCNGCLGYPEANLKFFLTNCSHIYCEKCVQACTKEKCQVCGSVCKTLLLNNKINKEIEGLFIDPSEVIKRCMKKIEQNLDFQKNHQKRLFKAMRAKMRAMRAELLTNQNKFQQARVMERELIRMRSENEYLKLLLSKKDSHISFSCDVNQHYAHNASMLQQVNKSGHLATAHHWGTPLKGSIHSINCTPTEFNNQDFPMSIPRPIVFPKSG